MRCKWHFPNEVSGNFSATPSFRLKSVWKSPEGHASLEVLLSRLEKKLFSNEINEPTQGNLSGEEWKALRALAAGKAILIKAADKGSSVVVWDRLTIFRRLLDNYRIKTSMRMSDFAKT